MTLNKNGYFLTVDIKFLNDGCSSITFSIISFGIGSLLYDLSEFFISINASHLFIDGTKQYLLNLSSER